MLRCPGVGNCQVLKSRGWGIYYILAKKIQIPGVLPGGGMVTAGIDPCITGTGLRIAESGLRITDCGL